MTETDLLQRLGDALLRYLARLDLDMTRMSINEQRALVGRVALDVLRETHDVVPRRAAAVPGQWAGARVPRRASDQMALDLPARHGGKAR